MAERSAPSDALRKLEEQLTCPICLEHFISPKTLPCLHPFCHQCLEGLPLDLQGQKHFLSCPTCRTPTELPEAGVAGFPVAFFVNNLIEVYSLLKKGSGDQQFSCDNCKKSDATGYCKQCSQFYCTKCLSGHNDQLTFVDHIVIGINEVTHGSFQPLEQPDITLTKSNEIKNVHESTEEVTDSKVSSCKSENGGISTGILCRAIVYYSYEAQDDDELSLEEGQIVEILDEISEGWWTGRVNGKKGLIPSNYVTKLNNEAISTGKVHGAIVYYSYEAQDDDEISLEVGQIVEIIDEYEDGWWTGRVNGMEGLIPSSYVKKLDNEVFTTGEKIMKIQTPMQPQKRRRRSLDYEKVTLDTTKTRSQIPSTCDSKGVLNHDCPTEVVINMDKWEVEKHAIQFGKQLHEGKFSEVWEGVWNNMTPTAVKIFKKGTMPVQKFLAEANVMKKLRHPKVLQLYAVSTIKEPIYIITELMTKGNLLNYLRGEGRHLQLPTLIDIGAQVANGMEYLGSQCYIHRNLAARNVLVGDNNIVKITDFGSVLFINRDETCTKETGRYRCPMKWAAPETFHNCFTLKSDVWSFGILLYELITYGSIPYPGMENNEVCAAIQQEYRMPIPKKCPEPLYNIMLECWKAETEERPTFEFLIYTLEDFFNIYTV